ncbi:sodium:solute symporter family transporter [Streptomyces violaceusniger]
MTVDYLVMAGYLLGIVGVGWWGKKRAASKSDFLVAGRRLGPLMYTGTMAAVVPGGASTIGGVRLGYTYGVSGAAMVCSIGLGLLALSVFFSARIARLRVYTVAEMLSLRYGDAAGTVSGIVMRVYTLMLVVTSTIAYASVFDVLFDVPRWVAVVIGGTIVVGYSALGGMWSITLTEGGTVAGVYCLVYALAGAFIGMATKVLYPNLASADEAFATIVKHALPTGIKGLVLAAALSAMMSTASGALIASATVATNDIWARLRHRGRHEAPAGPEDQDDVGSNRLAIAILGVASMVIACLLGDVIEALTVAYNLLVGGLLVPILGGLIWRRGNLPGAMASMIAGGATVITFMVADGLLANEPVYYGLLASLIVYVAVSLATKPTEEAVVAAWRRRLAGEPAGTPEFSAV